MKQQIKNQRNKPSLTVLNTNKYAYKNISLDDLEAMIAAKTEGLTGTALGERKLEVIQPIALDFLMKINESRQHQDIQTIALVLQHVFRTWLRKQNGIQNSYQMLLDEHLIRNEDRKTPLLYQLEFILANTIHFIPRHATSKNIAPSKQQAEKIDSSIRRLQSALSNFGGIYCQIEAKQHLLQHLLNDIISEQNGCVRSIYSSGTSRDLTRAIITKKIIEQLHITFLAKQPHARIIAKIALEMTSIFFTPMDISDATDLSRVIKTNAKQSKEFVNQTICKYLSQSFEI